MTRENSLFLSAAYQNDHNELVPVAGYFRSLFCHNKIWIHGVGASRSLAKEEIDTRAIKFLEKIGTGVVGFRREEIPVSEDLRKAQDDINNVLRRLIGDQFEADVDTSKSVKFELAHRANDGGKVYFDLDNESAGTRRLLTLLGPVFHALEKGHPLVIDELDASLHTEACHALIELFSTPRTNPKGAQLIATTHDTNLLRSQSLRRDQTWFIEKSERGDSRLFPLTDVRTRRGDNIEKGYLQGRYGGIVFPGPLDEFAEFG